MKERLVEMVRKGIPDKEIMRQLGIQTKASLKKMYYDALVEGGKIKDIVTEKQMKKAAPKRGTLTIGKRGTMCIPLNPSTCSSVNRPLVPKLIVHMVGAERRWY